MAFFIHPQNNNNNKINKTWYTHQFIALV